MNVPVNEPVVSQESKDNVNEALDTVWISSAGKYVEQFEENFANYLGLKHGITTSNGTTALHTALLALGVGEGDEVIVPAFTMIASHFSIIYTGAKPIFVDCEMDTYNIDVSKIEEKITARTKAIMPVHIYGHPCDMDPILEIAKKHNLLVIEDAAEVHGATYKGRKAGTMSDIACFSFYGNKNITTGEGGMIVTDNDELAMKCRKIKDLYHSEKRFIHDHVGYNYRLTNLQAAIGVGELQHIEEYITKKQWMADRYATHLNDVKGMKLPITKPDVRNVYWMYAVLLDDSFGMTKDELRAALKENGIDTRDFFYSPSDQPVFKELYGDVGTFPNTAHIAEYGLYLPSGLAITEEQIDYVGTTIRAIVSQVQ